MDTRSELAEVTYPIHVMGEFNAVKGIIYSMPSKKDVGYVYLFHCRDHRLKVGKSKDIANRLKAHEHGLTVYGQTSIDYIAVSNPTGAYHEIESKLISILGETFPNGSITSEWYKTHLCQKAFGIFSEALTGYHYHACPSYPTFFDSFISLISRYFQSFPSERSLVLEQKELFKQMSESGMPHMENSGSLFKKTSVLVDRYPLHIKRDASTFTINRSVLDSDLIYKPTLIDRLYYENPQK